jgi:hypothetical protein
LNPVVIDNSSHSTLRLGLPPQDIMPNNCHSCHLYSVRNLSLVEKNEWHHLTCMQGHGGREITIRHNQVVATIERFAKLAAATVVIEPKNLFSESLNALIYRLS